MISKVIAIYPGRFQPFGKHHETAYRALQKKFGQANTYIATSDKVEFPKSPFTFKDKKQILSLYGLQDDVVLTKQPYVATEILQQFDPNTTAVVFMVGEKDMREDPRFAMKPKKDGSESFYKPYEANKNNLQGYDKHGYLFVAPHVSLNVPGFGEMSGTSLRKLLSSNLSQENQQKVFKAVFGQWDPKVAKLIFDKLKIKSEMNLFTKDWWSESLNLDEDDDPCWDGYKQIGMKKKGKREVPNCVPESVTEGYPTPAMAKKHTQKISKLRDFLSSNTGREFVYSFNDFPKTVYGVKMLESLLKEGGAGGHMAHPFDIPTVTNGTDLISVFNKSVDYLSKTAASVKIDGVNASIRLIEIDGQKTFVMDRGSNKPLDVKGITKAELEDRFGAGHGMIIVGGKVLDIFNDAIPAITSDLKKLGLWDNPNIMFNIEYVAGSTNVLNYGKNFLAIHGLLEIKQVTPTKRATSEKTYNKAVMKQLIINLTPTASEQGYEVLGSVPTKLEGTPNLDAALSKTYTINLTPDKKVTKSLKTLLSKASNPKDSRIKTKEGKDIGALSKEVLIKIADGIPLSEWVADPKDYQLAIDGFTIYMATMKLGDAVLEKLTSPLGPVTEHEGIVIRDKSIYNKPFKITGKFILGGLATSFRK